MPAGPAALSLDARDRLLVAIAGLVSVALVLAPVLVSEASMTALSDAIRNESGVYGAHVEIDRLNAERLSLVEEIADADADFARDYRSLDDRLSAAIERLRGRGTDEEIDAKDAVAHAYRAMASDEGDALALALGGRAQEAAVRLDDPAYRAAKGEFIEAMARSRENLADRVFAARDGARAVHARTRLFSIAAAVALLAMWAGVYRRFQARAGKLEDSRLALEQATAELHRRERESQTTAMANSPVAMAEFEFPPAMKLVAWLRSRGVDDLERWLKLFPGEIRKLAPHLRVVRINAAAARLIGAKDVAQARELARWLPDRSLHACALSILRALWTQKKTTAFDIDATSFDGAPLTLSVHGQLLRRASTKRLVMACALQDTTEIAHMRADLAAAKSDASEAERARADFISSVSHDLRSPLNGVLGMAAALDRTPLDKEQRNLLTAIADAGEVMRDALDRSLDLSKLEAGTLELESAPFDIDTVARAVDARFAVPARAKNIRLRVNVDDSARRRATGDETRTRQILSKLVANAVRCTQRGEVEARLLVESDDAGGHELVMTVRDTGAGMTAAEIDRATSATGVASGGLALCRRLCEAMGGMMSITSSADLGTTVVARVKIDAPAASRPAEPAGHAEDEAAGAAALDGLRLLAADDNEINRIVLSDFLEPLNPDLTIMENGADALAAWRTQDFDAVLLDIQMPLLNGHDVAREIRRLEAEEGLARTPIIALSAGVMADEVQACFAAGMDAHVSKPIDPDKLFAALRDVMAGRSKAVAPGGSDAPDASGARSA